MIRLNKPKFWDRKKSILSILLYPITLITILYIYLKRKFTKEIKFKIPIICVGNIYIGGTGKTPTSIYLANEVSKLGKNPSILRKYYRNHADEYRLIEKKFKNLIIKNNRLDGVKNAEDLNFDSVILDDGLQDYSIKKDLSIVCFNNNQLAGNELVLPSGPLRENLNTLKNSEIVIINGNENKEFEKKILEINKKLDIFYSCYNPINLNQFNNKKLFAIAGIGNPENFIKLIEDNNLNIKKKLFFPDHYKFSKTEIETIIKEAKENNYEIIMTEKDYCKIEHFQFKELNYLEVSLEIKNKKKLMNRISLLYDKKN